MKRIFYLFLAVILFYPAKAQIFAPVETSDHFNKPARQKYLPGPVKPGCIVSSENEINLMSNLEHISKSFEKGSYYRSISFDLTWAEQLHEALDNVISSNNIPGGSMAVYAPGQGLFTAVSGISTEGVPVSGEMRFGIGSNTKLFIAVTLLKLQEEGLVNLDDPLYQWLPSYPFIDSSATVRQLLKHHTGFFDFWNDNLTLITDSIWADTSRFWTSGEVLATIGPPHFEPGTRYSYSNTNYILAALVIEAATGQSWVQALHEYIFDPLVMDSTFVGAFEPRNGPVSSEYDYFNDIEIVNAPMTAEYSQAHGAGGILSTAQEMALWYHALFSGNLINASSMEQLTDFEPSSLYGLGLAVYEYDQFKAYNHTGGMLGYISLMWYDQVSGAILALLFNGQDAIQNPFDPVLTSFLFEYPKQTNDAGIIDIISPWSNFCNENLTPEVVLTNHGSAPLTSVEIHYYIDEDVAADFSWSGSLISGDTAHIILPPLTAGDGSHTFTCFTSGPNGEPEGNTFNDTATGKFIVNIDPALAIPLHESFTGAIFPPDGWSSKAQAVKYWNRTSLVSFEGSGSLAKNNYVDYNLGALYFLDLPLLDITGENEAVLDFAYAYAQFPGYTGDSLQVLLSPDCGISWQKLFNKGGSQLSTAPATSDLFYPSPAQWKEVNIPLTGYTGEVLIRFIAVNGYGNNLYLDDINVSISTGTDENQLQAFYSAYPNPVASNLYITGLPKSSEIHLTDIAGNSLIKLRAGDKTTVLDMQALPEGIYILRTPLGSKKIVKI